MRRVVSLYLPTWPTDRLRRAMGASAPSPDVPLVLVGRDGRKRRVLAADAAAQGLGLHSGMAVAKAQALVAELIVMDADAEADAQGLDRLALWALRRYMYFLSHAEAAAILQVKESTVSWRLHDIRKQLQLLQQQPDGGWEFSL